MSIAEIDPQLYQLFEQALSKLKQGKKPVLNKDISKLYAELFSESLTKGYGTSVLDVDPTTPLHQQLTQMELSQIEFAAAKQARMLNDMNLAVQSFDAKTLATWFESYHYVQNRVWLEAETLMIEANAQMAQRWHQMKMLDTLPNLRYETVGDANVRLEHQALDGINLPIDDPFWDKFYPPNGYRCRCDVQQNDDEVSSSLPDIKENETVPKIFQFNAGKENRVVSSEHPYFKDIDKKQLTQHCESFSEFYKNAKK